MTGGLLLLPHEPRVRLVEIARLAEAAGHGIGQVMIHPFAPPGGHADDTIRRFGADVLPAGRRTLGR